MARDAGRSPWRRALALVAATALLAGCAAEHGATVRSRERGTLSPIRTIQGGRLATRVDALGTPNPGALGGFQPLVFPVAVAMAGPDLYIADAGAGRLYRFEQALLALVPVAGVSALPGIRLQGGPDGSLYFLDPGASEIRRVARVGRPPPAMLPRLPASRYVEFAVDPVTSAGSVRAIASAQLSPGGPAGHGQVSSRVIGPSSASEKELTWT